MERKLLTKDSYKLLVNKLISQNYQVVAPIKKDAVIDFYKIASFDEITEDYIVTVSSAKSMVFPRNEQLFTYEKQNKKLEQKDFNFDSIPQSVLLGVRPCDAFGFDSLSSIFCWDAVDKIYTTRLERTTIIGMSCSKADEYCFCTSVKGSPGSTAGSDILLTKMHNGDYIAEILTENGAKLAADFSDLFTADAGADKETLLANVPAGFNVDDVLAKINAKFEDEAFWTDQAMRCLGCGACAYVCPTCACFDIQDESRGKNGHRVRCWDSCGLSLFTLHTSGHNPRENQGQRWRQRLMHKFSYMPDRLNTIGCVGCGRCSRACPVDMNIAEHCKSIVEN
ncbi:MAG: 4Fe-4S dicluster domain-containing protein [Bacteroidota bacterium]